jgi:hypothetical protein
MSHDELTALVKELKEEMASLDSTDQETRVRLQSLVSSLEARVAEDAPGENDDDLLDSLRDSVERFEVEHPRATGIINQIMVMLGNMGI